MKIKGENDIGENTICLFIAFISLLDTQCCQSTGQASWNDGSGSYYQTAR